MAIRIEPAASDFSDWAGLLRLLEEAFASMEGRIDPPSSVHRLTPAIELGENHATFGAMGFVRTGEHAHEGYHRPTLVTMRKRIAGVP